MTGFRGLLDRRRERRQSVEKLAVELTSASSDLQRATLDLRLTIDRLQGATTKAGGRK